MKGKAGGTKPSLNINLDGLTSVVFKYAGQEQIIHPGEMFVIMQKVREMIYGSQTSLRE